MTRSQSTPASSQIIWLESRVSDLESEIQRLTVCLAKASSQAEHFEREWYLRGDEVERLKVELEATERQVEILSDTLSEHRKRMTPAELLQELERLYPETKKLPPRFMQFAHAIERHHGIGETP